MRCKQGHLCFGKYQNPQSKFLMFPQFPQMFSLFPVGQRTVVAAFCTSDGAHCANTVVFKSKLVCSRSTPLVECTRTHFQCLWISQHEHYCPLRGWHRHVLCHTWLRLFVIFSPSGQRIFVYRGAVAAEPFPNVNNSQAASQ